MTAWNSRARSSFRERDQFFSRHAFNFFLPSISPSTHNCGSGGSRAFRFELGDGHSNDEAARDLDAFEQGEHLAALARPARAR
jgi:hypothetical protein